MPNKKKPIPPETDTNVVSFLKLIKKTLGLSLATGLSYTYSFNLVVLAIMAGHLGSEEDKDTHLAATNLATTTLNTNILLAQSLFFSVSQNLGPYIVQNNKEKAQGALKQAMLVSVPIGLAATLPLIYSEELLVGLGQNPEAAELAGSYLRAVFPVIFPNIWHLCAEQILCCFEKQTHAMMMALVNFALGTLISYVLCFGKWGAPKLGFPGIAYGLIIEECLTLVMFCVYIAKHPELKAFKFFDNFFTLFKDELAQMKMLLKKGWPTTVTVLSEISAAFLITLFVGWRGKDQLAAHNFGAQFINFMMIPPFAFAQTTMQLVGKAIANENNPVEHARKQAIAGLGSSVALIVPFCLAVMAYPQILDQILSDSDDVDPDILQLAHQLVRITAAGVLADALRFNIWRVLMVTGDGNKATLMANISIWAGVSLAYLLGNLTPLGVTGIVMGYEIGAIGLGAGLMAPKWYQSLRSENLQKLHEESKKENQSLTQPLLQNENPEDALQSVTGSIQEIIPKKTSRQKVGFCSIS